MRVTLHTAVLLWSTRGNNNSKDVEILCRVFQIITEGQFCSPMLLLALQRDFDLASTLSPSKGAGFAEPSSFDRLWMTIVVSKTELFGQLLPEISL